MARRNVGDVERVSATNIVNDLGVPTDPTTLTLKVLAPGDLTVTTYTYPTDPIIVKDSTGNYHADLPLDASGTWRYDWQGTGAAAFSEGGKFYVFDLVTA